MSNSPEIHPYLIQQKEAHDRELVRQGSNPLSPYVLHQFTPETMVHNFLMEIGSYVTIKDWHSQFCKSPNFMNVRVGIIQTVYYLLRQRNPTATPEWLKVLPNVAKQIELRLYYMADNLDEYQNTSNVKDRIKILVDGILKSGIYESKALMDVLASSTPAAPSALSVNNQSMNSPISFLHDQQSLDPPGSMSMSSFSSTVSSPQQPNIEGQGRIHAGTSSGNIPHGTYTGNFDSRTDTTLQSTNTVPEARLGNGTHMTTKASNPAMSYPEIKESTSSMETTIGHSNTIEKIDEGAFRRANTVQVSSQGCSRAYIITVLLYIAQFTKERYLPSIFTFKREFVQKWLDSAKNDCVNNMNFNAMEDYYGGPLFDETNKASHWQEPMHLYTWWKNSIERKIKFKGIHEIAMYCGSDIKKVQKKRFSQTLVVLTSIIRRNSESFATSGSCGVHKKMYANDGNENGDIDGQEEFYYVNPYYHDHSNVINSQKIVNRIIADVQNMREIDPSRVQACIDRWNTTQDLANDAERTRSCVIMPENKADYSQFPLKLFNIISDDSIDVISWRNDCNEFEIKDQNRFVKTILPKYFNYHSFSSFRRHMNLYGIRSGSSGNKGCYSHRAMISNDRKSCEKISRAITSNLTDNELLEISKTFEDVVEPTKRCRFRIFHIDDVGNDDDDADMNTILTDFDQGEIELSMYSQLCTLHEKLQDTDGGDTNESLFKRCRVDNSCMNSLPHTYMSKKTAPGHQESRVGNEYQANITDMNLEGSSTTPKTRVLDCKVWSPSADTLICTVDIILKRIKERDIDVNLCPGMVLVACIDKSTCMCKLVTIISLKESPGRENAESREMTVFDGIETHKITAGDSILYGCGFSDLIHEAIQNLAKLNHENFQSLNSQAQYVVCDKVESIAFKSYFGARKSKQAACGDMGVFIGGKLAKYSEEIDGSKTYQDWSFLEAKLFCEGLEKFGGDLRKVWSTLQETRSMKDVIDFYYRIYPHCRNGGVQSLLRIYEARDAVIMGTLEVDYDAKEEEKRNLIFKVIKMEKNYEDMQRRYAELNSSEKRKNSNSLPYCPTDY